MAAELLPMLARAGDSDNNPLSGALWYFYATGTTTPRSVYTTAALDVAHANPVVADSAGKFAPIYFDASLSYRGVLKDAGGATIFDVDPINSGTLSALGASAGAGNVGFSHSATYAAATLGKSLQQREINVKDAPYSATGDGTADDTAAFRDAEAALTGGGVILVPAGTYSVSYVPVANSGVTIRGIGGDVIIKKRGSAGASERGVFAVLNMLDANFTVENIIFDLNGEGPYGIGTAGRIANVYAANTVAQVKGITGPANAAVYALRASHILVENCTIKNSGENGLLFRNCGNWTVKGCKFDNIANWGVEISLTAAGSDGGTGTMPDRDHALVEKNTFNRCNDFAMGSGNGGAIGGGGEPGASIAFKNYRFLNNSVMRSHRGIQVEFPKADSYLLGAEISGNDFDEIGQNPITFIGLKDANIANNRARNVGHPAAFALFYQKVNDGGGTPTYPDIGGVILSTLFSNVKISKFIQTDDRSADGVIYLTDGVATSGDATFTSASAAFDSADVGKRIAVLGAGPDSGNVVLETTIASVNSATSIELAQAPYTSASAAKFAYGGASRNGIIAYTGASVDIEDCTVVAGTSMGLTAEPTASAIEIEAISDRVRIAGSTLTAPSNGGSTPAGLRMIDAFAGKLHLPPSNVITGFTATLVGVETNKASVIPVSTSFTEDRALAPSATANTYGSMEIIYPATGAASFLEVTCGSFEALGTFGGGETVTFKVQLYYYDGVDGTAVEIPVTATGTTQLTAKNFVALNPSGSRFRAAGISMKSSAASSTVTGKANLVARQ